MNKRIIFTAIAMIAYQGISYGMAKRDAESMDENNNGNTTSMFIFTGQSNSGETNHQPREAELDDFDDDLDLWTDKAPDDYSDYEQWCLQKHKQWCLQQKEKQRAKECLKKLRQSRVADIKKLSKIGAQKIINKVPYTELELDKAETQCRIAQLGIIFIGDRERMITSLHKQQALTNIANIKNKLKDREPNAFAALYAPLDQACTPMDQDRRE